MEREREREDESKTVITKVRDLRGQAGRMEEQPALIRERLPVAPVVFFPFFSRPPSRRERVLKNSFRAKENSPGV